jgi:hypothetical protein
MKNAEEWQRKHILFNDAMIVRFYFQSVSMFGFEMLDSHQALSRNISRIYDGRRANANKPS